jgi:hypothetical protein
MHLRWGPKSGGTEGFCWFASVPEAAQCLHAELEERISEHGAGLEESGACGAAVGKVFARIERMDDLPIDAINLIAPGVLKVQWAGDLDSLFLGNHPFARAVQDDFLDNIFGDERGQGPDGTPLEDFVNHLDHYRS